MIHKTIDNTRVFQKNKFHSWEVADPRNKMIFLWRQSIINFILCRFNLFIDMKNVIGGRHAERGMNLLCPISHNC